MWIEMFFIEFEGKIENVRGKRFYCLGTSIILVIYLKFSSII